MTIRLTILNPKTQNFSDTGGGFDTISPQDLCAAMAGIDAIGEFVIRRRHLNPQERGLGYASIYRMSVIEICNQDKQPNKTDMIGSLLDIALDDYFDNVACPVCKGRGEVTRMGITRKCHSTRCKEGRIDRKDSERYKLLGVDRYDYAKHYKPAYRIIYKILCETLPEAESRAVGLIERRMNR